MARPSAKTMTRLYEQLTEATQLSDPFTTKEVKVLTGKHTSYISGMLRTMSEVGLVESIGRGSGQKWRLNEATPAVEKAIEKYGIRGAKSEEYTPAKVAKAKAFADQWLEEQSNRSPHAPKVKRKGDRIEITFSVPMDEFLKGLMG